MNFKRILLNTILFILLSVMASGGLSHAAAITYTYDNLNRLTKVDYGNGTTTEYTYDAIGNRITLLTIDATPPSNPASTSSYSNSLKTTTLTSDNWYNYPEPHFEWNGATDASGISGYYVYFGPLSTTDPVTAGIYQTSSSYTVSTTLISGSTYYLLIKAKDNPGNIATSPYTAFIYNYDNIPPETTITGQPSNLTNSTSASFDFLSTELGSTFQCQLDNNGWSFCTSPKSYTGLAEGDHAFYVKATDRAGNTDPAPASYAWTIDTTSPSNPSNISGYDSTIKTTTLTSGNWYNHSAPYFEWSGASDSSGIAGYYVYFGPSSTADPVTAGIYQTSSNYTVSATLTSNTTYYLLIKAKDNAGNAAANTYTAFTYRFDNTSPDTSITSQPSNLTNSISAIFSFMATEAGSTFECQLDSGGYSPCKSPKSYTGLAEGSHTFSVKATDVAGNTDPTPASYSWTVDTTQPSGSITINNGASYTNSLSVTLTLTCTDASGCSEMQFSNDGAIWSSAEAYGTNRPWILSDGDGTKTIYARFKDTAGNWSDAYSDTIVLDTVPPNTFITSQPLDPTNATSASFSFMSLEDDSAFECQIDGGGYSTCTSPKSYTGLGEGEHTFHIRATDAAGNTDGTPESYTWTVDLTAPVLILSTLSDGAATNNPILNIAGTVTDNTGIQGLVINGQEIAVNADGSFSHAIELTEGVNAITTIATDLAGNETTDTRGITLDLTAPFLDITAPTDNSKTADPVIDVTGTIGESATVEIRLNDGAVQPASISGNTFTATLALTAGINTIEITATDLAGNKATQKRTVTYDNTSPSLEVTNPDQDIKTNQSSIVIRGTVSDTLTAVNITIKVDSDIFTPQVTDGQFEQAVTFSSEKTYQITVTAADEAGNITTVQRNIIYDITGPSFDAVVTTPTNDSSQTISGNREENATITVVSSSATVGVVTYPTSTT